VDSRFRGNDMAFIVMACACEVVFVMPAQAESYPSCPRRRASSKTQPSASWIQAFAGMTWPLSSCPRR
jgi:hypothetical protein